MPCTHDSHACNITRRTFLRDSSVGLGSLALASLLARATSPRAPAEPARAAAAALPGRRRSASSTCTCPARRRTSTCSTTSRSWSSATGQDCPDEFLKGKRFAFTSGVPKLLGTPRTFTQHGKGGVWMSDAVPHLHDVADDLCVIQSMNTDQFNHAPAELLLYTGSPRPGRPSMGSWVTYGLGTREREPARLRRADLQRRAAHRRPELLGQRLPAVRLPGRAVPLARATRSSTSPTRRAWTATCAARASTPCAT